MGMLNDNFQFQILKHFSDPDGAFIIADAETEDRIMQACPILTTCSSRESGDSTCTSRMSRKTIFTIGSICSSRDVVFFSEIK